MMSDNRLTPPGLPFPLKIIFSQDFFAAESEKEFQRKLNQSGIRSRGGAGDHSEVRVIRLATGSVRGSELGAIEQVEELHPELHSGALLRVQQEFLEHGEVEIVDSMRTKC